MNQKPTGSRATHHAHRKRLRKQLEARGLPPAEIAQRVEAMKRRQQAHRSGSSMQADYEQWYADNRAVDPSRRERLEAETYERLSLDDSGHRPAVPDPLLRGPARATGQAAKAVKRGKTVTLHEYREADS